MARKLMFLALAFALTTSAAMAGGYLGAGTGRSYQKNEDRAFGIDFSDNASAWKIFAGYTFLKFLGVEGSYVDFGTVEGRDAGLDIRTSAKALDAFAMAKIPLAVFQPYVKVGFAYVDSHAHFSSVASASDRSLDRAWGIGLGINFLKKLHVRAEYEQFDVNPDYDSFKPNANLYLLSVGAAWRF
jgi:opacity protein-like surface antigen